MQFLRGDGFGPDLAAVVADDTVPAPVTGLGGGFTVATSTTSFRAIDLDWTSYNEWAQRDVVRYRVYVAQTFFDNALDPI